MAIESLSCRWFLGWALLWLNLDQWFFGFLAALLISRGKRHGNLSGAHCSTCGCQILFRKIPPSNPTEHYCKIKYAAFCSQLVRTQSYGAVHTILSRKLRCHDRDWMDHQCRESTSVLAKEIHHSIPVDSQPSKHYKRCLQGAGVQCTFQVGGNC